MPVFLLNNSIVLTIMHTGILYVCMCASCVQCQTYTLLYSLLLLLPVEYHFQDTYNERRGEGKEKVGRGRGTSRKHVYKYINQEKKHSDRKINQGPEGAVYLLFPIGILSGGIAGFSVCQRDGGQIIRVALARIKPTDTCTQQSNNYTSSTALLP